MSTTAERTTHRVTVTLELDTAQDPAEQLDNGWVSYCPCGCGDVDGEPPTMGTDMLEEAISNAVNAALVGRLDGYVLRVTARAHRPPQPAPPGPDEPF